MVEKNKKTVCAVDSCTGCMACVGKCKKNAIEIKDDIISYNAVIDEHKCINCGLCQKVCPNNQKLDLIQPISWNEGWATDGLRINASSGGIASEIMRKFVVDGGYVAACLFKNGEFVFDITNKQEDLNKFVGSKYVKSNPKGIYDKIIEKLRNNSKVLFIGLPCQVAGLKNFILGLSADKIESLYTVDLICHGTPSTKILNKFLAEKNINIKKVEDIRFRQKTKFGLSIEDKIQKYKNTTPIGVQDMYTFAFLTSLDYTENCYTCNYATLGRVSDVTIGDSWGSNLPDEEQGKGVSLILCQTEKGINLIEKSRLKLKDVDLNRAIETNHQLSYPSIRPKERKIFFVNLEKGFHRAVAKSLPKVYYRQKIKEYLIKMKIIRRRVAAIEYKVCIKE